MPAFKSDIMSTAEALAHYLLNGIGALEVQLFGGAAIYEDGGDGRIELIVIVNEEVAWDFLRAIRSCKNDAESAAERLRGALATLGIDQFTVDRIRGKSSLDIFLFPPNWWLKTDALQAALPMMTTGFVMRAATEARPYNLKHKEFEAF